MNVVLEKLLKVIDLFGEDLSLCDACYRSPSDCDACKNEQLAEFLLSHGCIVFPVLPGDKIYMLLCDDVLENPWFISEETVTEVCSKGFYISSYVPPRDDRGPFISYDELSRGCFISFEAAQNALAKKEKK